MKFSKFSLSVSIAVASILIVTGCDDRDHVLGGAAVGAIAGAVIMDRMDRADDKHRDYHYRRPSPPPYYQQYRHDRYGDGYNGNRYRRSHCGYDRYGNLYPCHRD